MATDQELLDKIGAIKNAIKAARQAFYDKRRQVISDTLTQLQTEVSTLVGGPVVGVTTGSSTTIPSGSTQSSLPSSSGSTSSSTPPPTNSNVELLPFGPDLQKALSDYLVSKGGSSDTISNLLAGKPLPLSTPYGLLVTDPNAPSKLVGLDLNDKITQPPYNFDGSEPIQNALVAMAQLVLAMPPIQTTQTQAPASSGQASTPGSPILTEVRGVVRAFNPSSGQYEFANDILLTAKAESQAGYFKGYVVWGAGSTSQGKQLPFFALSGHPFVVQPGNFAALGYGAYVNQMMDDMSYQLGQNMAFP